MKKLFRYFFSDFLHLYSTPCAKPCRRIDETSTRKSYEKEYIKARYLFLQAYNAFATQDKYAQAVECGVNASALYHRENYYKEAFELLRGAEQVVATGEQKTGKAMPNLRFRINKERLQMYINLKIPHVPRNS